MTKETTNNSRVSSGKITVLCPRNGEIPTAVAGGVPFAPAVKAMITSFSRQLARHPGAREFPEIMALAHWIRPRAIADIEQEFNADLPENCTALGRGQALHFAPGNVDTIFLYSALLSVLAGNANIIRVSSRVSPQIELLVDVLNKVVADPEFVEISDRLIVIRYERSDDITRSLSERCDVRVIWGGDETVKELRAFPLPVRGRDISFPDRWSLCVLDAAAVIREGGGIRELTRKFSNDAYWFGQMACSSPRIVLWRGSQDQAQEASGVFWAGLSESAKQFSADYQAVQFVDKLVAQCSAAIAGEISSVRKLDTNMVSVAQLRTLNTPADELMHIGGGMFWEARLDDLDQLKPLLDSRSQTIASFGVDEADWRAWVSDGGANIDRIVPVGQALQFSRFWDGMDLMREFTRLVSLEV